MKKAVLLLSYGSLNAERLVEKYESVLQSLKEKYKGYDFYLTYSSKKIHEEHENIHKNPREKVLQLKEEGYGEILVVPALLFFGTNYTDLKEELSGFHIPIGVPLLSLKENIDLFLKSYSKTEGKLLLIAHRPASSEGEKQVLEINRYLKKKCPSMQIFFFSPIEEKEIYDFLGEDNKASLYPLFVYSNYHLTKDILYPKSPLNKILCKKYNIKFIGKTLIDEPFFIEMILHSIEKLKKSLL